MATLTPIKRAASNADDPKSREETPKVGYGKA
jgi:hypothetical protein